MCEPMLTSVSSPTEWMATVAMSQRAQMRQLLERDHGSLRLSRKEVGRSHIAMEKGRRRMTSIATTATRPSGTLIAMIGEEETTNPAEAELHTGQGGGETIAIPRTTAETDEIDHSRDQGRGHRLEEGEDHTRGRRLDGREVYRHTLKSRRSGA